MTKWGRKQKIRNQEIQKTRKKYYTPQMIEKVYKTDLILKDMFTFMQHKVCR